MNAKSDEGKIIRELKKRKFHKATAEELLAALGSKWTMEALRTKLTALDRDDSSGVFLVRRGVQYFGVERGAYPGLYKVVTRGIERKWAKSVSISHARVELTFKQVTNFGKWTRPDFVISSRRTLGGMPVTQFHVLEVEQQAGFGIQSVYQAYEQARGAHFSWVLFTGPLGPEVELTRIQVAAKDLGVGLVHMPRPSAPSGWVTMRRAKLRSPKPAELKSFRIRCGLLEENPVPAQQSKAQ